MGESGLCQLSYSAEKGIGSRIGSPGVDNPWDYANFPSSPYSSPPIRQDPLSEDKLDPRREEDTQGCMGVLRAHVGSDRRVNTSYVALPRCAKACSRTRAEGDSYTSRGVADKTAASVSVVLSGGRRSSDRLIVHDRAAVDRRGRSRKL